MKALLLDAANCTAHVTTVPIPSPGPNELLISVKAIALNPVDAHYTSQPLGSTGRVVGSDFAGLVVGRGPPAPPSGDETTTNGGGGPSRLRRSGTAMSVSVNRGDRVAGFLQGACSINDLPGAFAEYVVCPADLVWRVPPHVTFEEAASISLAALTAAQGIFFRMGLDAPFEWEDDSEEGLLRFVEKDGARDRPRAKPFTFLVVGASYSEGMYAAQLVRRSAELTGRKCVLVGTAGARHHQTLMTAPYHYDALFDYTDTKLEERIREHLPTGVDFAYDATSDERAVVLARSLLNQGGKLAGVQPRDAGASSPRDVATEPITGPVWEGLGEDVEFQKFVLQKSPAKRSFATAFYKWLSDGGALDPNPVRIMPGGLDKVVGDGFSLFATDHSDQSKARNEDHMRPVGGEKLVYKIEAKTGESGA